MRVVSGLMTYLRETSSAMEASVIGYDQKTCHSDSITATLTVDTNLALAIGVCGLITNILTKS